MSQSRESRDFIPALRFPALTRYFDWVMASTLKEEKFQTLLIDQAAIAPGSRVLDLGCGTGTLAVMVKQRVPKAHVSALDADPEALALARAKADVASSEVEFRRALACISHRRPVRGREDRRPGDGNRGSA
jgi:ubiquinone/menaquinone biosynthesis C-methylase UbiE